ncbi:MAG: alpha/beta hydrolase [Pseudomonadota bacterium]
MSWENRPRSELGGLACITVGPASGTPVLLLHGVGLRAEAWDGQLSALARHRVIAPDMPGHGESAALEGEPMLSRYSDRLASLVETLGSPAVVIGHSMGAMIALDFASRFPDRCRGVAAVSAIFRRSAEAAANVSQRAAALLSGAGSDPSSTLARWFGAEDNPAMVEACDRWLRGADLAGYGAAYTVFAAEDGPSEAALAALGCPALFLNGALDPNSTPAMAGAMAALTPDGVAEVIPGAAHMVPMTHSAAVNAALLSFIRRCMGAPT